MLLPGRNKEKSTNKTDGVVALIMAPDRAIRCGYVLENFINVIFSYVFDFGIIGFKHIYGTPLHFLGLNVFNCNLFLCIFPYCILAVSE